MEENDTILREFEDLLSKKYYQRAQDFLSGLDQQEEKFLQNYDKRKIEGVYYTDDEISRFIIEKTLISYLNHSLKLDLEKLDEVKDLEAEWSKNVHNLFKNVSICDPTCGSGNFLVNSAIFLYEVLKDISNEKDPTKLKLQILRRIHGFDINKSALLLTKLKLMRWLFDANFEVYPKIRSILDINIKTCNSLFNFKNNDSRFDILVGNPPYGNILTKEEKDILKKEQVFFKDIYCAYILKALDMSNHFVGFLVPKSFLLRQGYITFRNELVSRAELINIYDLGSNIFKKATNEVQILIYKKKNFSSEHSSKESLSALKIYKYPNHKYLSYKNQQFDTLRICQNQQCRMNNRTKKFYIYTFKEFCGFCSFKTTKMNRIRIKCTEEILNLINKIESIGDMNYLNIEHYPLLIRGEEASGLKLVKRELNRNEEGNCFFIDAKYDFNPFYFHKSNSFNLNNIDAQNLKGDAKEYYKNPKVLIKHNNVYPEALYTEKYTCFTSSIYSLLYNDKTELKYLCGLLNSLLIHFYCVYGINNQENTTINLNQYMIRHLPIVKAEKSKKKQIADIVDLISEELSITNGELNTTLKSNFIALNDLIFRLYSLEKKRNQILMLSKINKINPFFTLIYKQNYD